MPLGAPVFLLTTQPNSDIPLQRLVMAQDTGGAIRGAIRVDYFFGFGTEASENAGRMKQRGNVWVLLPKYAQLLVGTRARTARIGFEQAIAPPTVNISAAGRHPGHAGADAVMLGDVAGGQRPEAVAPARKRMVETMRPRYSSGVTFCRSVM